MILERDVESRLGKCVRDADGLCVKFVPDAMAGMPDRIVILPGGVLVWVELKRPSGGVLSARQKYRHAQLRRLGQRVAVCWSDADVDRLLDELTCGRA